MKNGISFFFLSLSLCGPAAAATDAEYDVNATSYSAIGATAAYELGFTGAGVTVAVVDNGTLTTHQEFANKFSSLQKTEYNVQEVMNHGTPVASLIAGAKDGQGMHGVAYDAQILAFAVQMTKGDCSTCYSDVEAWETLAGSAFDSVKIVNNSFGENLYLPSEYSNSSEINAMKALIAKDKLIVASAGNETSLSPSRSPAGLPYYEPGLKYNFINAIAYNPSYSSSSPNFLTDYTNLAQYAQEWSLATPVAFLTAASSEGNDQYDGFAGTSAAAPIISGAAAVVSSAFPYMGGKQLADVLFSTADKDYENFSNYMIQSGDEKTQFLFFGTSDGYGQDWTDEEKEAIVQSKLGSGYTCDSDGVVCADVSYADVFGQGLLNLENAVKGPGFFDIGRLTTSDYSDSQYWYTVDTAGYDSIWSNDIGQVQASSDDSSSEEANVGLRKKGSGTLTLSGNNTFAGTSAVEGGTLELTGSLAGGVTVNGGTFSINGSSAVLNGVLTVNKSGKATINAGTLKSTLTNSGTVQAVRGTITGNIVNEGAFFVSGVQENGSVTSGHLTVSGTVSNNGQWEFQTGGTYLGSLNNRSGVTVTGNSTLNGTIHNLPAGTLTVNQGVTLAGGTVDNSGYLGGSGTLGGTVINTEKGSVETSLTAATLNSAGTLVIVKKDSDITAMQVGTLNITGGQFALAQIDKSYENGQTYTIINFDTLTAFQDFESESMLTDFISASAQQNTNTIDMTIHYQSLASTAYAPNLTPSERQVAAVIDRLFQEDQLDLGGFYFFSQGGLKKQINKMKDQVRPLRFSALPLSNKLTRGVQTHLFERQREKDPMRYEGRMQYYSPSSKGRILKGDPYRQYRPGNTPQENYRHEAPRPHDVYRQYRPDNAPRQEYRHYMPKKRDVYQRYRPNGRSGGQPYGIRKQAWGQLLYHQGTLKGDSTANSVDADSKGMGAMFGWDFVYSSDFLWGLTAGYAQASLDQGQDSTDITDWRFGAYFSRQKDFVSIDGVLMIGRQNYDKTRATVLPVETLKSTASFNGTSIEAALNVGYDIQPLPLQAGDWSLRPYAGLTIAQMTQDAYHEKGSSDVNLSVKKSTDTSVMLSPGLIAGYTMGEMNLFLFQPEYIFFDVRYDQLLTGGSPKTKAYFSADTLQTTFDSLDDNEEKSAFSVGVGINGRFSDKTQLHLLFNQRTGSKSSMRTISVSLIHSF
ncbi:MAG: autotransporter domain-containing protein [Alphaproteobacteria bacterium]|nr:autotransporter domain-containing protein [Alphaproteobacteria bacterium]